MLATALTSLELTCDRREDSSDSEHGARHSRQTRVTAVPPPSSSSSRDRRHTHIVTPRQCTDHTRPSVVTTPVASSCAWQSAAVSGRHPQCVRDDSVDSFRSSMSAGTRCVASSHPSVAPPPYLRTINQLHRRGPMYGGLTARVAPETCV